MENSKSVILYHSTNKENYDKILKSSYIGLTEQDYRKIAYDILTDFHVVNVKLKNRVISKMTDFECGDKVYENMKRNGCVSFLPDFNKSCSVFGEIGGEQLSINVKSTIKSIYRYYGKHYSKRDKEIQQILRKYDGARSPIVVLKFNIPVILLDNFSEANYKAGREICSSSKVPIEYLVDMHEIN